VLLHFFKFECFEKTAPNHIRHVCFGIKKEGVVITQELIGLKHVEHRESNNFHDEYINDDTYQDAVKRRIYLILEKNVLGQQNKIVHEYNPKGLPNCKVPAVRLVVGFFWHFQIID
jgi:hypothetical protein